MRGPEREGKRPSLTSISRDVPERRFGRKGFEISDETGDSSAWERLPSIGRDALCCDGVFSHGIVDPLAAPLIRRAFVFLPSRCMTGWDSTVQRSQTLTAGSRYVPF